MNIHLITIFSLLILLSALVNVSFGFIRRRQGYAPVGGRDLQWKYVMAILQNITRSSSNREWSSVMSKMLIGFWVQIFAKLNRLTEKPGHRFWEKVLIAALSVLFQVLDIVIGVMVKLLLLSYAFVRAVCSVEMRTFEESRKEKWAAMPYEDIASYHGRRYKIMFVRHGESMWNKLFNRGWSPASFQRIVSGLWQELLFSTEIDSSIIDSPLSTVGVNQAQSLSQWSKERRMQDHNQEIYCYVTSNLRRAIATMLIGFGMYLNSNTKARVLSSISEVTRNIDSITFAFEGTSTPPNLIASSEVPSSITSSINNKLMWSRNYGNRGLFDKVEDRFAKFLLQLDEMHDLERITTFVVVGHSLFFRNFIRYYTPNHKNVLSARLKITNCGVLEFDMLCSEHAGQRYHAIDTQSIKLARGSYLGH